MPQYDSFNAARDENRNPLSHYALDETEPSQPPANHHLDNAVTSLCLALQWAKDGDTATRILLSMKAACEAKFGQGSLL